MGYVYEGGEDTDVLIARARALVHQASRPVRVLELGCGPGRVAEALVEEEKVAVYVGVDKSSEAIRLARERVKHGKAVFVEGDVHDLSPAWFEGRDLPDAYDVILANPPYLPSPRGEEEKLGEDVRLALIGGEKGFELVNMFAAAAFRLANVGSRLVLVTSSLSRPWVTREEVEKQGWDVTAEEVIPVGLFERLVVFTLRASMLAAARRAWNLSELEFLTRGWHSRVWRGVLDEKKVVVKRSSAERVVREAIVLESIAPHLPEGVRVPRVLGVRVEKDRDAWGEVMGDGVVLMPFFEGIPLARAPRERLERVFPLYCEALARLDRLGLVKGEASRPGRNVLLLPDDTLVLLDFERSKPYSAREWRVLRERGVGRNVREALQFARRHGLRCEPGE